MAAFPELLKKHWLDAVLYLGICALAVTGLCMLPVFFPSAEAYMLQIDVDGQIVMEIDLNQEEGERSFVVDGAAGDVTVGVRHNAACILEAPCPEQYCVRMGWVSDGRPIVCAHSHMALLFEASDPEVDVIL